MKPLVFSTVLICGIVVAGCSRAMGPPVTPIGLESNGFSRSAGAAYQVLHSFGSGTDGIAPYASLIDVKGMLYGTTLSGGLHVDYGTVYRVSTKGKERVLHSFNSGSHGNSPYASLIDVNGTLYGTTFYGGVGCSLCGTVFSVSMAGREHVLHGFEKGEDGAAPYASLDDVKGTLYGTTSGGAYGEGSVFSVTTTGTERVLYDFAGGTDGARPSAGLIAVNGRLYGTTYYGGGTGCSNGSGCGTVFRVNATGRKERVLHSFGSGMDGALPYASMIDVKGTLYGTTGAGGTGSCSTSIGAPGCGTVFSVTAAGKEHAIYSFKGGTDGIQPTASLIDVKGTLYGTTFYGGMYGGGTVFSVTTTGNERVLHSFGSGSDGAYPHAGLIDVNGMLYGTTQRGGMYGLGTVFALSP
jgi:uncharacterized repeat protein (TIGR03803 family)